MLTTRQKFNLLDQFFTSADIIDLAIIEYQLKKEIPNFSKNKQSNVCQFLDQLDTNNIDRIKTAIKGLYLFCVESYEDMIHISAANVEIVYQMDGLSLILGHLPDMLNFLLDEIDGIDENNDGARLLAWEQDFRIILNLCFLLIIQNFENPTLSEELLNSPLESVILEVLRLSLDISLIPFKKVTMMLYLHLYCIFKEPIPNRNSKKYLTKEEVAEINREDPRIFLENPTQVEKFYQRLILRGQEGTKPQILIKAIITALLAVSPTSNSNKIVIDVTREWKSPYLLLEQLQKLDGKLSTIISMRKQYIDYKDGKNQVQDIKKEQNSETPRSVSEGERHRIMMGNIIVKTFDLLIHKFGENNLFQYMYLAQMIADQQGVLVFIKFLTDNFGYLSSKMIPCVFQPQYEERDYTELTEESVFNSLKLTYKVCRGSPEKIETNLIEYNGYFLVKKMPSSFKSSQRMIPLCHKLIKIQARQFTKKMRQMQANMKVVAEIYCKEMDLKKIEKLKKKIALMAQMSEDFKQDDIRKLLSDFNNYNYLNPKPKSEIKNRKTENLAQDIGTIFHKMWIESKLPENFENNYEKWLEDNVWNNHD